MSLDHYYLDLPGPNWFSGAEIYARFVDRARDGAVAVELGSWKGRSTACMGVEIANSGKAIVFHAVDHWLGSVEPAHDADHDIAAGQLFETFCRNIAPVARHVDAISADTLEATDRFADESIDFLYIDASHTYDGVLSDLKAWFPKVRPGGLIAGDDWCFKTDRAFGVRHAVLDFFGDEAARLAVEAGSAPNAKWLQWSIVKSFASPRSGSHRARAKIALRRVQRSLLRGYSLLRRRIGMAIRS